MQGGENADKQLRHDFVVRELYGPYKLAAKDTLEANITDARIKDARVTSAEKAGPDGKQQASQQWQVTLGPEWKSRDVDIAAFVQNRSNGDLLQALHLTSCLN